MLHTCSARAEVQGVPAAPVISTRIGFLLLHVNAIVSFDQKQAKSKRIKKRVWHVQLQMNVIEASTSAVKLKKWSGAHYMGQGR
jgi:hypothetical protein